MLVFKLREDNNVCVCVCMLSNVSNIIVFHSSNIRADNRDLRFSFFLCPFIRLYNLRQNKLKLSKIANGEGKVSVLRCHELTGAFSRRVQIQRARSLRVSAN